MNNSFDFQHKTAERILSIFKNGHRRVLLADEVGLGKTFVAKQVIDLVRKWHKEEIKDDFFKVVYVCSNANIADQNIEKLRGNNSSNVDNHMSISESRLSMQHLYITLSEKENKSKVENGEMPESIIPLTPTTSFRFSSAQGTVKERALIYEILSHLEEFKHVIDKLSEFLSCNVKDWDYYKNYYKRKVNECGEDYLDKMKKYLQSKLTEDLIQRINNLFTANNCENRQKAETINAIRRIFAEISIDMLEPDLVIMDEFQRFDSLLEQGDDEKSMLAHKFFNNNQQNTKILLLSATPYKPYSTLEDLNEDGCDEHYQDFMKVMDFLFVTKDMRDDFRLTWKHYSDILKRTEVTDLPPLISAKNKAEEVLYGVMCRTERFNSGIIDDSGVVDVKVLQEDILSYAQGQCMIDWLQKNHSNTSLGKLPLEYVKSSPYLLSFMDKYELKKRIKNLMKDTDVLTKCKTDMLLLSRYNINNYRQIPIINGKLQKLHNIVFGEKGEKKSHLLLWMPASNPYYKAGGLFESEDARQFSKVILFSSWEMVPRMISVMMSYYSEFYTLGKIKENVAELRYLPQKKSRYGVNRLRSDEKHYDKLLLEYPCIALASLYSPEEYYGKELRNIKKDIGKKINNLLDNHDYTHSLQRKERGSAKNILSIMKLLDGVMMEDFDDLYMPGNALDVLTDIAIASPAVCAYRQSQDVEDAKKVAKAIVSLFNKSESAAVIDLIYSKKNDENYYESVLDYCVIGNLQSVLDEYAHMLQTDHIGRAIEEAIIETSNLTIDTIGSKDPKDPKDSVSEMVMRCHFAIPFVDKTITDEGVARTTNIRKSFNSPFRPFILSTTSIGQEGLDFHWYARKIVHWNLPSNPVDLEQREGRINRFKCLAIRKNLVDLFGRDKYECWDDIFEKAKIELKANYSDMVPFWCLPIDKLTNEQRDKLYYIERIVPLYPLSRDRYKYERLIKVLSLYRMTLGQPRQEDLLELLKNMRLTDLQLKELTIDLCPFNKERSFL